MIFIPFFQQIVAVFCTLAVASATPGLFFSKSISIGVPAVSYAAPAVSYAAPAVSYSAPITYAAPTRVATYAVQPAVHYTAAPAISYAAAPVAYAAPRVSTYVVQPQTYSVGYSGIKSIGLVKSW